MERSAPVESFDAMTARHAKELKDLNNAHKVLQEKYAKGADQRSENFKRLQDMRKEELENLELKQAAVPGSMEDKTADRNFHDLKLRKSELSKKLFGKEDVGMVSNSFFNGEFENSADIMQAEFTKIDNNNYRDQSDTELEKKQNALIKAQKQELERATQTKLSLVEQKDLSVIERIKAFFGGGEVGTAADSINGIVGNNDTNTSLSVADKINIKNALKNLDEKQRVAVLDRIILKIPDTMEFTRREEFITFINTILPENEQVDMKRNGLHDTHVVKKP
jgi:hypothetical protein